MTEQQSTLILPTKAIAEMRQMAKDRMGNIPSPRGPAEFDFQPPLTNDEKLGSSNDDYVKVCVPSISYDILNRP